MEAGPQMILTLNKNRFLENLNCLQISAILSCSSKMVINKILRLSNDFLGIPRGRAFYREVSQKTLKIRPIFKYIKQIKVLLYVIEAWLSENKKKWGCLSHLGGVVGVCQGCHFTGTRQNCTDL